MTIATDQIIREIDLRVDQLLQAKFLILGDSAASQPPHSSASKLRLVQLRASSTLDQPPAQLPRPRRQISPAGRRRMQLAQRRRWKKFRLAQAAERKAEARQKKQSAVA